jgi:F-type H+-transporting ATPase subunit b
MRFDWVTFALQIVNFAVLVWLLQRFLYRPVLKLIDARKIEVQSRFDEAEAAKSEAQALLEATRSERAGVAAEREQALMAAAVQADELITMRREKAESEAAAVLLDARRTLASEREAALALLQRAALDLGADAARRLLAEMPVKLRAEAWLERIESYLASLPEEKLNELVGQLNHGAALTVMTAYPLPEDVEKSWRSRLRQPFGERVTVTFSHDPDLVAGAELHFPSAILSFSWRSEVAALRSEIEARFPNGELPDVDARG